MKTREQLNKCCFKLERELFTYGLDNIEQTIVLQSLLSRRYSEIARLNLAQEGIPIEVK